MTYLVRLINAARSVKSCLLGDEEWRRKRGTLTTSHYLLQHVMLISERNTCVFQGCWSEENGSFSQRIAFLVWGVELLFIALFYLITPFLHNVAGSLGLSKPPVLVAIYVRGS